MHPILVQFTETFFIGTYGVFIALGLAGACWLASVRAAKRGIPGEAIYDLTFVAVLSGFLGARILFILLDLKGFVADPMPYLLSRTGFVFFGGLLAAIPACIWFVRRRGLDAWKVADIVGPSIAFGHAMGRIGCHFAGCCYGGRCDLPIGITVPRIETADGNAWPNAWLDQLQAGLVAVDAPRSLPIWPVQLFESAALLALMAALLLFARRDRAPGANFGAYLVGYSLIRFGLEFFRGDEARGLFWGISTSQWISAATLAAGIAILAIAPILAKRRTQ